MKKTLSFVVAATLILTLLPGLASAKDMTGRFGIGGDTTVAGVNGISARFQIVKNFGIQAVASIDNSSATEESGNDDVDITLRSINVALRGDIQITGVSASKGPNLGLFFGVNVINGLIDPDPADADNDINETIFPLEFGLKIEHFFNNHFSVHLELGALLVFYDEKQQVFVNGAIPLTEGKGQIFRLGVADSFGDAGFTFWFN